MKRRLSLLLGSVFYIGLIPGPKGTYASIAATLVFYLFHRSGHRIIPELHLSFVCLISVLGVLVSAEVSQNLGVEDPSLVVIDEVAGQLVAFLFFPVTTWNLILGTVFFRAFDIWKPFPVRQLEPLKNGVGIMADDLAAGIYANLLLHLVNWLVNR